MSLPTDLFLWLKGLHAIEDEDFVSNENIQIITDITLEEIQSGTTALLVLKKICEFKTMKHLAPKIKKEEHGVNIAKKIQNWKHAFDIFYKLGLAFEEEVTKLVINGDYAMIIDVLRSIKKKFGSGMKSTEMASTLNKISISESQIISQRKLMKKRMTNESKFLRSSMPTLRSMGITRNQSYGGGKLPLIHDFHVTNASQFVPVNIERLDYNQNLGEIENLFQFMIISLSKALMIKPKNVVCFFASGGRILANVTIKGLRATGFDSILKWFGIIKENLEKILGMIMQDPTHSMLHLLLTSLKPGLLSREPKVVTLTCDILIQFAELLMEKNQLQPAYNWIKSKKGILTVALSGMKRHVDLLTKIMDVLKTYSQESHLIELLYSIEDFLPSNQQMNYFIHNTMYLYYIDEIMRSQFIEARMGATWSSRIAVQLRSREHKFNPELYFGVCYLIDFWDIQGERFGGFQGISRPSLLKSITDYVIQIRKKKNVLISSKRKIRTFSSLMVSSNKDRVTLMTQVFRLLRIFTEMNFEDDEGKINKELQNSYNELIDQLLMIIKAGFKKFGTSDTLRCYLANNLLPFVKEKKVNFSEYFEDYLKWILEHISQNRRLNIYDMELMMEFAKNLVLEVQRVIKILDKLMNLFYSSLVTSQFILMVVMVILKKYQKEPKIVKFCKIIAKVSLNRFLVFERKRKRPIGTLTGVIVDPDKIKVDRFAREMFNEIALAQKRAMIIELVKELYYLEIPVLRVELKNLLVYTNLLFKDMMKEKDLGLKKLPNSKALVAGLSLFGDPDNIIAKEEIEAEFRIRSGGVASLDNIDFDLDGDELAMKGNPRNLNLMKSKMSKERLYMLAMQRGVKADPKVFTMLKNIKKEREDKLKLEEKKKEKIEKKKKERMEEAREQVAIANMEHGVSKAKVKDYEANLLRPLDTVNAIDEGIHLLRIEEYEDHDIKAVDSLMKKYGRLFKTYFLNYIKGGLNDKLKQLQRKSKKVIFRAALWSFVKDKKLDQQASIDTVNELVREINSQLMNNRGEINYLDYKGFTQFLIQLSNIVYKELSHMPPAFSLKKFIDHLESVDGKDKRLGKIFKDPEYAGVDDIDLINFLNGQLKEHPEIYVPENYVVNTRSEVSYEFKLHDKLDVPDSWRYCYEILDDLLFKALNFRIVEPTPKVEEISYVKPRVFFGAALSKRLKSSLMDKIPKMSDKKPIKIKEPIKLEEEEKKMMFAPPQVTLSTSLKYQVATYPLKDRTVAKDVAYILEEMLDGVEEGYDPEEEGEFELLRIINQKIMNEAMIAKEDVKMNQQMQDMKSQVEWKERGMYLKGRIEKLKAKKVKKLAKKKEKEAKRKKRQERKDRKLKKKFEAEERKRLKAVKDKKERMKQAKEEAEERRKEEALDKERERKADFLDFNYKQIIGFKKGWKKIVKERKKRQERWENYQNNYWNNIHKMNEENLKQFTEEKKEFEEMKKEEKEKFEQLKENEAMKSQVKKYESSLKCVFDHYAKEGYFEIGQVDANDYIGNNEFDEMCTQLNLFPVLINVKQLRRWKHDQENKKIVHPLGYNYNLFKEFLATVFFKNQKFLGYYMKEKQNEENPKSEGEEEDNEEDEPSELKDDKRGKKSSRRDRNKSKDKDNEKSRRTEVGKKSERGRKRDSKGKVIRYSEKSEEDSKREEDGEDDLEIKNSFEGLMAYMNIPRDSKQMKLILKQYKEDYKNKPSMLKKKEAKKIYMDHEEKPPERELSPIMKDVPPEKRFKPGRIKLKKSEPEEDSKKEKTKPSYRSRTRETGRKSQRDDKSERSRKSSAKSKKSKVEEEDKKKKKKKGKKKKKKGR